VRARQTSGYEIGANAATGGHALSSMINTQGIR
jgi:hypothetical protein